MLFEKRSDVFHVNQQPPGWVVKNWGEETYSGETITVEGSLSVSAVLAAFTVLIEDIASLPLILYHRLDRGKERAYKNPYYALLHDRPNPEHTSMVYREIQCGHLLGWGNHYSQMIWDKNGIVRELWPLRPDRMRVFRENGVRKYLYRTQDGSERAFRQDEIWHIPAFGFDGLIGYSRISLARNAIGLSIAAEKYGSRIFKNDARPSVAIKLPGHFDLTTDKGQKAYEAMKLSWQAAYGGENLGKPGILEDGAEIQEIGFPPEDTQFLQTRQFQVAEIARIFRIPPHMIGDVEKSTSWGSGIEQQEQGYVAHALRPWTTRIEQQADKDILLPAEQQDYFWEHLFEDLLRGDTTARYTAYTQALTSGWLTDNEVRERENMNPYEGGDAHRHQLNTTPTSGAPASKNGKDIPEPLLRDVVERLVRRESHELTDAKKRWVEKNKPEKFEAWFAQFYEQDHVDFIRQALRPFTEAGYLTPEGVAQVAGEYCARRQSAETNLDAEFATPQVMANEFMMLLSEELF